MLPCMGVLGRPCPSATSPQTRSSPRKAAATNTPGRQKNRFRTKLAMQNSRRSAASAAAPDCISARFFKCQLTAPSASATPKPPGTPPTADSSPSTPETAANSSPPPPPPPEANTTHPLHLPSPHAPPAHRYLLLCTTSSRRPGSNKPAAHHTLRHSTVQLPSPAPATIPPPDPPTRQSPTSRYRPMEPPAQIPSTAPSSKTPPATIPPTASDSSSAAPTTLLSHPPPP